MDTVKREGGRGVAVSTGRRNDGLVGKRVQGFRV
jgi:hypothetical protein